MAQLRNPFFNRHRITDPAYFFGRQRELERLYSAIATRQCVSVVGERKLGKSSLLTRLSHAHTLQSFGLDPALYVFVYFDLESMASARRDDFWMELLDTIASQLPPGDMAQGLRKQIDSGEVRFMTARRALRRLRDTGFEVVLMLDEFESLARNAQFDPDFYGELRSLAGELGLVIITASKRSLYDLTYENSSTLSSPFFNIFSEMPIGLMTLDDARAVLIGLSGHSGAAFCAEEVEWALDLCGPHPFFTQVIGAHLFEAPGSGQLRSAEVYETIRKRFTAEAEDHYRYIWASLDSSEQSGLLALPRAAEPILKTLRAKSLVREIDDQPMPFSDAFAAFLERERRKVRSISGGEQATAMRDLTGKTLGSYRVLEPLGRGGMAEVYKGYHPLLDRYVAIKVLLAHLVSDSSFIKGERLSTSDVLALTAELASALDHAHANGLVHRDVKPANILLREVAADSSEAILTDFGIAKILEGIQFTETGLSMGTPDYMSPEQAAGDVITPQTDVYALGIVVFEMLTNQLPFRADTPAAVLLKHINTDPPSPRTIDPSVPAALDTVLFRALAKRARDRWSSAGEFARALGQVLTPGAADEATLEFER
jgi:hypothetical protein